MHTTLETTQGRIDGLLGQHPFKCYLQEVATVGDCLAICRWVASRVGWSAQESGVARNVSLSSEGSSHTVGYLGIVAPFGLHVCGSIRRNLLLSLRNCIYRMAY